MADRTRAWAPSADALVALALVAPAVPLVVALLARRVPTWVPDLDLALTELRVRDVGGPDSPLIGLPGRIGTFDRQGSHPGPISFYLLAPTYRLLGSTAFALQVATVVVHLAAVVTTILLVARRAGPRWALATGLALAFLVTALGPNLFTEPWNPHLPVLWWPAFLAAAWLALCGDVVALPALVVAGGVCAQTHVAYLGSVAVLTALAAAVCLRWPDGASTAHARRWTAAAALLLVAIWAPPVLDQVQHDPGNARLLADHLLDPSEGTVGWTDGARLVLERLDLVHVGRAAVDDPGRLADAVAHGAAAWRGALLLGGLALAGAAAVRHHGSRERRAAAALGWCAVVLAVVSANRIVGFPWGYLLLLVWPVALLIVLAVSANLPRPARASRRWLLGALVAALLATTVRAGVTAERAEATNAVVGRTVLALVPDVLEDVDPDGRYLLEWEDSVHLGGHGYGLFVELERRDVDVSAPPRLATQLGEHRTGSEPVEGRLVVVSGDAIARWDADQRAVEIARADVRTAGERRRATSTRAALITDLQAAGLDELVPVVDANVLAVALDPRVSTRVRDLALALDALGAPAAVFLVAA